MEGRGDGDREREAERFMLLRVREVDGGETKGFRREMINAEVGRLASSCSLPIRLSIFPFSLIFSHLPRSDFHASECVREGDGASAGVTFSRTK